MINQIFFELSFLGIILIISKNINNNEKDIYEGRSLCMKGL